ncbi:uncharacterized protein LOC129752838 [Uranotaenia lowii]|uniref:uncharacterized protein LOC129752838 n=1 Tax=Uranotaenia lowii TaxID=190385 RepID=UPI00247B12CB|nr:uncharacterized protein LOC129752838 [Uranotaenia lowii]
MVPYFKNAFSQTEPDEAAEEHDTLTTKVNKCLLLLSHLNAKLDALAGRLMEHGTSSASPVTINEPPLQPVKSLADLEALEDRCRDRKFVQATVASLGMLHGQNRFYKQGATVSLQIIDYFFCRAFLTKCSWTGASRTSTSAAGSKQQKIPFIKFDKTINLFYRTVQYSDPLYSLDECKSFLHRCLKNSKQRFLEMSGTRKPVSRQRKRKAVESEDENRDSVEKSIEDMQSNITWQVEFLEGDEEVKILP